MASNGTAETPAMTLQRLRPGLQVVGDHAVAGTQLTALGVPFAYQQRTARYVMIENGVIDAWRDEPLSKFVPMLSAMISLIREEGRVPVLTGYSRQVPGPTLSFEAVARRDQYDAIARTVAANANVEFADWGAAQFAGDADLLDGVHPNKAYSDRLVEQLAAALDKAAPECAK